MKLNPYLLAGAIFAGERRRQRRRRLRGAAAHGCGIARFERRCRRAAAGDPGQGRPPRQRAEPRQSGDRRSQSRDESRPHVAVGPKDRADRRSGGENRPRRMLAHIAGPLAAAAVLAATSAPLSAQTASAISPSFLPSPSAQPSASPQPSASSQPSSAPSSAPRARRLVLQAQSVTSYVNQQFAGPGVLPPEAPLFAGGSPVSPGHTVRLLDVVADRHRTGCEQHVPARRDVRALAGVAGVRDARRRHRIRHGQRDRVLGRTAAARVERASGQRRRGAAPAGRVSDARRPRRDRSHASERAVRDDPPQRRLADAARRLVRSSRRRRRSSSTRRSRRTRRSRSPSPCPKVSAIRPRRWISLLRVARRCRCSASIWWRAPIRDHARDHRRRAAAAVRHPCADARAPPSRFTAAGAHRTAARSCASPAPAIPCRRRSSSAARRSSSIPRSARSRSRT